MKTPRFTIAMALFTASLWAAAQSGTPATQTFEVTAARSDVRALCPTIDTALEERLGHLVWRERAPALLQVRFDIEGTRIDDVQISGGTLVHRLATHRALRNLDCDNGRVARQTVHLEVHFVEPGAAARRERIAMSVPGTAH